MNLKKSYLMNFLVLAIFTFASLNSFSQFPEKPNPPRLVNDFANFLSPDEQARLEQKLVDFNDSTSTQISIVTLNDLGPYEISDYAFQLGEKWGIGRKQKNNGVLIVASKTQREVFIATGYGVEDVLPDAICKRIVEQIIIPNFKTGNFYAGFNSATNEIMARLTGKFQAEPTKEVDDIPLWKAIIFIILIIILIIILSANQGNNGGTISGRGFRGSGGGPIIWGGGGFGGGSSSSGGGFGGFGGGSFGGGGAGGKW